MGAAALPFLVWYFLPLRKTKPCQCKAKMRLSTWSLTSAILILSWAVLLIVETFWWFWTSELVHRIVMFIGGCFGLYWGVLYFALKK